MADTCFHYPACGYMGCKGGEDCAYAKPRRPAEEPTDEEVALAICSYNNWSRDMLVSARTHVKYADTRAVALRHVLKDFLKGRTQSSGRRAKE